MASLIAWIATGCRVGDFVTIPSVLGDATVLIVGEHKTLGWTLMGDDDTTVAHKYAPAGLRPATPAEVAEWKRRSGRE